MNFKLFGSALISSSSISPVMATLVKVRYVATTLSKRPLLHSSMNSWRDRALGSMSSPISESALHSALALLKGYTRISKLHGRGNYSMAYWSISPNKRICGLVIVKIGDT